MRPTKERLEEIRRYPDGTYCSTLVKDAVAEIDVLQKENHILCESLADMRTALARAIVEFQIIGDDDRAERFERDLQENRTIDIEEYESSYEQICKLKLRIKKLREALIKSKEVDCAFTAAPIITRDLTCDHCDAIKATIAVDDELEKK